MRHGAGWTQYPFSMSVNPGNVRHDQNRLSKDGSIGIRVLILSVFQKAVPGEKVFPRCGVACPESSLVPTRPHQALMRTEALGIARAALLAPYSDDLGNSGLDDAQTRGALPIFPVRTSQRVIQVNTHAIWRQKA